MALEKLQQIICEVLVEIQTQSGREVSRVDGRTCPIGDLHGFDSLSGLEATVELSQRLGCEIPEDVNLLVNEKGTRALRVEEVAKRLEAMLLQGAQ
jgi:acyl carrier protein